MGSEQKLPPVSQEVKPEAISSEVFLEPPREKKRYRIRAQHSVHDRMQIESNVTFDLKPRHEQEQTRDFKIDIYYFMPNSVGVNSTTYDSEQFFRHQTSYFRVRTPQYPRLRTIEPAELRLESAEAYFVRHLSVLERTRLGARVVQDVRLFGNFLHTDLKKIRASISGKKKAVKIKDKPDLMRSLLHRTDLLWAFRERYLKPIRQERLLVEEEVVRAFSLTDEYLSYRLELVLLRAKGVWPHFGEELQARLDSEIAYREEHGFLILGGLAQDSVEFEAYTYRLGLLKKYMGEALFLQKKDNKKDTLYKNYAAAIGAGLAATFAGLAEHQRVQYLTGNDSGMRLGFLIAVAVLAYIFKDRVKDLSKEYFNSRLKERLPDQGFELSYRGYSPKGKENVRKLGSVSEYFRFLRDVPSDVAYLRTLRQSTATDPQRQESIMHIGRRFSFELRSKKQRRRFSLVKNVFRLDISPFLGKLDNPTTPVSFIAEDGTSRTVQAPKVYHLNVVVRYEVLFKDSEKRHQVDYERFRLIVNKNGIVRLEKILEAGRLGYEEVLT